MKKHLKYNNLSFDYIANKEGKYIAFELDISIDNGPLLALFKITNGRAEKIFDPSKYSSMDYELNNKVKKILRKLNVIDIYTLAEKNLPKLDYFYDIPMQYDDGAKWGEYRPLEMCCWSDFFEQEGITLNELHYASN